MNCFPRAWCALAVPLFFPIMVPIALAAAETRIIPNPLGQDWPWELVSMDFTPGAVQADWVVTIAGIPEPRPLQIEQVTVDGKRLDRVWFIATLGSKQKDAAVTFSPGSPGSPEKAASVLVVKGSGASTEVDTGIAEIRLQLGPVTKGTPFNKVPHWLGGVRVKGNHEWDGRAWFDGSAAVAELAVTSRVTGPVFAEWHVTYVFSEPLTTGTVSAVPVMLGKHSFRYAPNQVPSETIPQDGRRYEVAIRAIAGHLWVEIAERYHLPRDPAVEGFGINQYTIALGKPSTESSLVPGFGSAGIPVDTMLWMRWFEYDSFGGNNEQLADPALPRAVQKGRPFAQLRPRWSQAPAGAQDCLVTSGGRTGLPLEELRAKVSGRVKEVNAEALKGDKGTKKLQPFFAQGGAAATALAAASGTDAAARIALAHVGSMVGLDLPSGVTYQADAPAIGVIAAYPSKWVGPYDATISVQARDNDRVTFRFPLTDGGSSQDTNKPLWYGNRCWVLIAGPRDRFDSTGKIEGLIRRTSDWTLTALINKYQLTWPGMGEGKIGPNPSQYLGKRYQCDDVNPTNYGNRRMVNQEFEKNLAKGAEFGARAAVCGYIYTDLDAWPGWHNGWGPGNPNFHTDKYMASLFAAVTLRKHPHAQEWLAFGRSCLDGDLAKVITAPDGVGSECPGYSGYALGLQAKVAEALLHAGLGNPFAENPLIAKTITWHRKLLTPYDRRLGLRHEAPIGDTHRWSSGAKFDELLPFYADSPVKKELEAAINLSKATAPGAGGAADLDWSSQAFGNFGAILRHRFGTLEESFLSLKSGSVSGHYHNDDQTFHWYHRGTPIALDYNCSYHPRGDHAALHNGLTLGAAGTLKHNANGKEISALEQPFGPAAVTRFVTTPTADVVIAERQITSLSLSPIDPHDSEFNRDYPGRKIDAAHRRLVLLTKQPAGSPLSDYLVVRDELRTTEPQQINLHVLAREAVINGGQVTLVGQWDQDILVAVVESTDLKIEPRQWAYADEWMAPPEEFLPKPGESTGAWNARLPAQRPPADWKPTFLKKEALAANQQRWAELIRTTDGMALMPPPGWTSTWIYGECQRWLRCSTKPGTPVTMVIYPYARGTTQPTITRDGEVITVTAGRASQRIRLASATGVSLDDVDLLPPHSLSKL